jgi:peptide/nickel transport system permease protein
VRSFVKGTLCRLLIRRLALGALTLLFASILIFAATQVLPGDAARAIAGRDAAPERLMALRHQMHLDQPLVVQYVAWLRGFIGGDLGTSLVNGLPVARLVLPRVGNSGILLVIVVIVSVPLSVLVGIVAALHHRRAFDTATSVIALALAAVPEFVVGIALILLFSTVVFHWLPPVSMMRPGHSALERPNILVLPVATLTLAVFSYLFRMTRGLMWTCWRATTSKWLCSRASAAAGWSSFTRC